MKALEGITILDLSSLLPGPYCTSLLCSMGAEVWKIERPGLGDFSRQTPESFVSLNWGKRSVTLDLSRPEGQAIFHRMAAKADVIMDGFRPGVVARLGVDYDTIRELNPGIVYCSISGFGQDGPYRDRPGHDASYQALTGALSRAGKLEPSATPSLSVADLASGLFAALAISSALVGRQQTGQGSYLDISMTDGVLSWVAMCDLIRVKIDSPKLGKISESLEVLPHYGAFEARDGKVLVLGIVNEEKFWKSFCTLTGLEEWAGVDVVGRLLRRQELTAELSRVFRERDRDEWVRLLEESDIPVEPVNTFEEAMRNPHFVHRQVISQVSGPGGSSMPLVRNPMSPSSTEIEGNGPPRLGEHTAEMLHSIGYSQEEIEHFRALRII